VVTFFDVARVLFVEPIQRKRSDKRKHHALPFHLEDLP